MFRVDDKDIVSDWNHVYLLGNTCSKLCRQALCSSFFFVDFKQVFASRIMHLAFTCLKSIIEAQEQSLKIVQYQGLLNYTRETLNKKMVATCFVSMVILMGQLQRMEVLSCNRKSFPPQKICCIWYNTQCECFIRVLMIVLLES